MVIDADGVKPIEFRSSLVEVDGGMLVIALFDGEPAACVAILKADPTAARSLSKRIGSALDLIE